MADYSSASLLNSMLHDDLSEDLVDMLKGRTVAVVGAGPSLTSVSHFSEERVIAADGASRYLMEKGITPDVVVTDLDGISEVFPTFYVVHAHGDNFHLLWRVGLMKKVVGTCQVAPFGRLKVFGGFTDGDRAVALALAAGAMKVRLYGMDFDSELTGKYSKPTLQDDIPSSPTKRAKLKIAKWVVEELMQDGLRHKV